MTTERADAIEEAPIVDLLIQAASPDTWEERVAAWDEIKRRDALLVAHRSEYLDGCHEFHNATDDEARASLADFESVTKEEA